MFHIVQNVNYLPYKTVVILSNLLSNFGLFMAFNSKFSNRIKRKSSIKYFIVFSQKVFIWDTHLSSNFRSNYFLNIKMPYFNIL